MCGAKALENAYGLGRMHALVARSFAALTARRTLLQSLLLMVLGRTTSSADAPTVGRLMTSSALRANNRHQRRNLDGIPVADALEDDVLTVHLLYRKTRDVTSLNCSHVRIDP
mmetsp:Transcript_36084/g.84591  ORF Transcript_36084/g.84591 Transcript_36084/m.84591 type:complete len:113 (-) Transcript_36084:46-384(-)